ncbi:MULTISPECIES: antitoxin Xre/MbcA/ParS toxin-binding domain-containing protein [Pseudoalteromonas]|uniref:antitoxin Xre/MbcA/ParS toxin-binding domain-containing protein n=1 Tax=Pseudoalteromonas TaxID=53246 RepID=UPI00068D8682|nr:antitoxin Xre/MbcA/ParS toxin-binding domain-containing protein [Pseudoalteromonas sp. A2]|tara:strand:+ start:368 stop:817 length:450 start_codon:yes stop_codon:yes gene_type:complete
MCNFSEIQAKIDFIEIITNKKISEESSYLEQINFIRQGVDIKNAECLRIELGWSLRVFSSAIRTNNSSYIRYKKELKPLNTNLSENVFEIAKFTSFCLDYFENIEQFNVWLNTPSLQFDCKRPLTLIDTIAGRESIKNTINMLKYGYNA